MIFGQETVILKLLWKPDGLQVQSQSSILAENRVGSKYLQSASGQCCERTLDYSKYFKNDLKHISERYLQSVEGTKGLKGI